METRPILIIGGAGFIGMNLALKAAEKGKPVIIFDNLSAPGSKGNLFKLSSLNPIVKPMVADIRDRARLREAVSQAWAVVHLAFSGSACSNDAMTDENVNVLGTLQLLEELRAAKSPPALIYVSTSEVYGILRGVEMYRKGTRYEPSDEWIAARGVPVEQPLELRTPYICSRASAESYVLDYAISFGLKAAVLRLSEVYGPGGNGSDDGLPVLRFVRDFMKGALAVKGDGLHVRDLLHIDDLCDALFVSLKKIERLSGEAFNLGGGPVNSLSALELAGLVSSFYGRVPEIVFRGAQARKYYVSDNAKFNAATGWSPYIGVKDGIKRVYSLFNERKQPVRVPRPPINEIYSNKP